MIELKTRNNDFIRRVEELRRTGSPGRGCLSVRAAVRRAINSGAPSFYISREHAWKQLRDRRRGIPPGEKPHRTAMWQELSRALGQRLASHPAEHPWLALDYVLANHHPSGFFISEEYALRLARNLMHPPRRRPGRPRKARSRPSASSSTLAVTRPD